MKDKICLITGATSGIGKVAATELARMGAHLIIHGRDAKKTEDTRKEIIKESGNTNIDSILADLSSLKDVRKMAAALIERYERLDVLINNAGGVMNEERAVSEEGYERTIVVNHLSPFLLTALLLDKLKKSKEARVINVSSMAYNMGKPDFKDFLMEKKYSSMLAYGNAKLYLILFTTELDKRLKAHGINNIKVNALHPGVVRTNFSKESNSRMKVFFKLFNIFLTSPEKGAGNTIFLASDTDAGKHSGLFFKKRKPVSLRKDLCNDENAKRVWEISEKLTGMKVL